MAIAGQRPGYNLSVKFGVDGRGAEVPYVVRNCLNINEAFEVALNTANAEIPVLMGMTPSGLSLIEELRTDPNTGLLDYEIGVAYSDGEKEKKEGDEETTFDTSGGTEKRTQSLYTTAYAPPGSVAPNFHGAINVTEHGVEGVEQPSPKLEITITHYWPSMFLSSGYLRILSYATGKKNANVWRGFLPGEALFLGASGSQSGEKPWKIQYKFAISENATNLIVPTPNGDIIVEEKKGWDYLWISYRQNQDTEAQILTRVPQAVYVEQTKHDVIFSEFQLND